MALGVLVTEGTLNGAEARLVRRGSSGVIRVRQDIEHTGRKRFATSHELGHWQLHEGVSQVFVCTSDDMHAHYKKSRVEAEANYFASALLMPEHLFVQQRADERPSFEQLELIADYFGTSLTATAIRWTDLANDYCALVVSQAGKIRWWRGSRRFEESLWIDVGQKIAPTSAVSQLIAPTREKTKPKEVPLGAWATERDELLADSFIEEAKGLGKYEDVLSLIWIP